MATQTRDLDGKHVIVTGANTGIGRVTAEALGARGAHVVVACRSEERTVPVIEAIRGAGGTAEWLALDLGDLASVRAATAKLVAAARPIDRLVANAGLAGHHGATRDGFELAFGTNHVGHFAFVVPLVPLLRAASDARVVVVSSKAHYEAKGIDWDAVRAPTKSAVGLPEYAVSKLANVLFAAELARRLGSDGPHTYSLHPGVIASDIWRRVPWPVRVIMKSFMLSNEEGAKTTLYCATSPDVAAHTGRYYDDAREKRPSAAASDPALARELWSRSVAWTGVDL